MQPEDAIRLRHMIEMAETALGFVQGRRREELEQDRLLAFGLARALEILGEAASKIAPGTRATLPQIPWTQLIGMRNRLAHAYLDINLNVIWKSATFEVSALLPILRAALGEDNSAR